MINKEVKLGCCSKGYVIRPEEPKDPLETWAATLEGNPNLLKTLQNMPKRKPVTDKISEESVTCDHGETWMEECAGCMLDMTQCISRLKGEPGSESFVEAINQARAMTALHERQKAWRDSGDHTGV